MFERRRGDGLRPGAYPLFATKLFLPVVTADEAGRVPVEHVMQFTVLCSKN